MTKPDKTPDQQIAESLEATPDLLPYLPELLADLHELGSSPRIVVDLLRPLGLPRGARVLDLGCGKGAVAVALASELGFVVQGVDLFQPFVQEARRAADQSGVGSLCQFKCIDLRDSLREERMFDVVVYASLGVLGRHDNCIAQLRQVVRSGGYVVIDDLHLGDLDELDQPGYEHYASRNEVRRRLTVHGDRILKEVTISRDEFAKTNRRMIDSIRAGATVLAQRHPQDAQRIMAYVRRQESECELLESHCVPTVWLLSR